MYNAKGLAHSFIFWVVNLDCYHPTYFNACPCDLLYHLLPLIKGTKYLRDNPYSWCCGRPWQSTVSTWRAKRRISGKGKFKAKNSRISSELHRRYGTKSCSFPDQIGPANTPSRTTFKLIQVEFTQRQGQTGQVAQHFDSMCCIGCNLMYLCLPTARGGIPMCTWRRDLALDICLERERSQGWLVDGAAGFCKAWHVKWCAGQLCRRSLTQTS